MKSLEVPDVRRYCEMFFITHGISTPPSGERMDLWVGRTDLADHTPAAAMPQLLPLRTLAALTAVPKKVLFGDSESLLPKVIILFKMN